MRPASPSQGAWHWQPLIAHTHTPHRRGREEGVGTGTTTMTPGSAATCRSLQVSPCEAQGLLCHPVCEGTIAASERQGGNMQHKNLSHPLLPSATPFPLSPPHPTQPSPPAAAPPPLQNAEHCNAFTQRKCLQTRASSSDAKGKKVPSLVTSPLRWERGGKGGYYGKLQPVTQCKTNPIACSLLSPA